jgi:hypothetical protein
MKLAARFHSQKQHHYFPQRARREKEEEDDAICIPADSRPSQSARKGSERFTAFRENK